MTSKQPKSAKANASTWQLWKMCQDLNPNEIEILITKRRNEIKYETNKKRITELRREISLLIDAYKIIKKEVG